MKWRIVTDGSLFRVQYRPHYWPFWSWALGDPVGYKEWRAVREFLDEQSALMFVTLRKRDEERALEQRRRRWKVI